MQQAVCRAIAWRIKTFASKPDASLTDRKQELRSHSRTGEKMTFD
jgi:hypothetical protein